MADVRVISSLAVFLFLLLASFSAARQERAARAAWEPLTDETLKTYNYLAFFHCDAAIQCSGSILSESMVLTYCGNVPINCTVHAGKVEVPTTKTTNGDTQVRQVKTVVKDDKSGLSICVMNTNWKFNQYVGAVTLNDKSGLPTVDCTVLGFRVANSKIVPHKMDQKIGADTLCQDNARGVGGVVEYLYAKAAAENEQLGDKDLGGPAICGKEQWGISMQLKPKDDTSQPKLFPCNWYINIAQYREWIDKQLQGGKNGTDGTGGTGGTGGNGTASSGYSIHSHLNKYSNWKVLWFLVPPIVAFLQY